MMIADLVDQEDFRERLQQLGVPVTRDLDPEACVATAMSWRESQDQAGQQQLDTLFQELLKHADLVLPEIKLAIEKVAV